MRQLAGPLLRQLANTSQLSLREIGRRAGTSHATLSAYINGHKSPSVATLQRIVEACDLALDFQLRPRVRAQNGLARGEELVQVLRLAEQFPARHTKGLQAPVFPRDN